MKIEILDLCNLKSDYVLDGTKQDLKLLKNNSKKNVIIEISEELLNLSTKLYGNNKKESITIQRENCKQLLKLYKYIKSAISILKSQNIDNLGVFYAKNLSNKKNNNDFSICSLLDIYYNVRPTQKLYQTMSYSCDYLDKENTLNNMCNFKDNLCICHRIKGKEKTSGCCASFCKYTASNVCKIKNLACKIFMCNYLEDNGYFFDIHSVPILKKHTTSFERFCTSGYLFKPLKKTVTQIKFVRFLSFTITLLLGFFALTLII